MTSPDVTETTKVAQDLTAIRELDKLLADQAAHKAGDPEMPGGQAMVMLAPVASPEAHEHRVDTAERLGTSLQHLSDEDPESHWTPLQTILFWSESLRMTHGNTTDMRPTIGTETAYLRQKLNWLWEHEPHWRDFARDIAQARTRLENTLHAGYTLYAIGEAFDRHHATVLSGVRKATLNEATVAGAYQGFRLLTSLEKGH